MCKIFTYEKKDMTLYRPQYESDAASISHWKHEAKISPKITIQIQD